MTKLDLIKALEPYPDNMDIFLAERKTDFTYGLLNSVSVKKINFIESPDDTEAMASERVIILDEE